MPRRKIPPDAFTFYMSLGPGRSYAQVAEKFGVTKRAVVKVATHERWQEQATELERKAREKTNQKVGESLEEMNERHLKILRVIQTKALETLKQYPLETALQAVRALEGVVRQERVIKGEPAGGGQGSVEEIIRREYERWMTTAGAESPEVETNKCGERS
ncbi:MAG: hypothetical protein HY717_11130 [Planctomycetes bacterium]|nr:hypothetical protein [Planctomycetota bacterium]